MKTYASQVRDMRDRRRGLSTTLVAVALLAALAACPQGLYAQAKVGTTGAQFLELGVSARAMGMAEAFTAVSNDVSAIYYNPAGLTSLLGKEAMATYIQMPADINYGFAAFAMPLEAVGGVVGVGVYSLNSGFMTKTTHNNGIQSGDGTEFQAVEFATALSYGRYLTDRFSLGVTVKYIREAYDGETANGWSADVGTSYDTGFRGFKIAMIITNFGPDLKFIQQAYPLPINFKFDGSINMVEHGSHVLTFAAEGSHPSDNLEKYNAGLEYTFNDRFILRGGSRFNYDVDGLTFGGGLRLPYAGDNELRIDYAYQDFGILTQVHRFSLMMSF